MRARRLFWMFVAFIVVGPSIGKPSGSVPKGAKLAGGPAGPLGTGSPAGPLGTGGLAGPLGTGGPAGSLGTGGPLGAGSPAIKKGSTPPKKRNVGHVIGKGPLEVSSDSGVNLEAKRQELTVRRFRKVLKNNLRAQMIELRRKLAADLKKSDADPKKVKEALVSMRKHSARLVMNVSRRVDKALNDLRYAEKGKAGKLVRTFHKTLSKYLAEQIAILKNELTAILTTLTPDKKKLAPALKTMLVHLETFAKKEGNRILQVMEKMNSAAKKRGI